MKKDLKHGFTITERDRFMRMWEKSMDLAKDFTAFSAEIDDYEMSSMLAEYAEDEGIHASWLRKELKRMDKFSDK